MRYTLEQPLRLTDTECAPVDPSEIVARGIYDDASPTTLAALFVVADWVLDQLDRNAPVDVFTDKLTYLRDRTEAMLDQRCATAFDGPQVCACGHQRSQHGRAGCRATIPQPNLPEDRKCGCER